ncbi:class I SAM-dependent methyltransferase [Shimazuella sp. AN120528]|uniref:class I SAM-dependent methyltransferase n=1 Tax=Shimazuella soli TaxID=1892854 RepID=UPI001F103AE9|nr:class I SAM-dependent methyltransferase [Shimazuella soli]MCH5586717.1 class I SAM-dependent methyltransferase [Shimazuella soli]
MLVKDIEKVIQLSAQSGWGYGGMALSSRAITHLCRRLEDRDEPYHILELGGGQSTLFWNELLNSELLPLRVTTLEHHHEWAKVLSDRVENSDHIRIFPQTLKQISDREWEEIFTTQDQFLTLWKSSGKPVSVQDYDLFTIRNTFYAEVGDLPLKEKSIDVMIVDGPHGNGRSLAYPLFRNVLKPNALILVDDFDHYPFLQDLQRVFSYEEIYREILGQERWTLVQIKEEKGEM